MADKYCWLLGVKAERDAKLQELQKHQEELHRPGSYHCPWLSGMNKKNLPLLAITISFFNQERC